MTTVDDNKTPEQIRADIEETRNVLGSDVDALADKVNPSSIAHRQTEKVKSRFASMKESLMGTTESTVDSVTDAGHTAVNAAKGHAFAVGLVAFGVGLMASSLLPASDAEKDLAGRVKEKAAPAVDAVKGAAQDAAANLKDPARDAFESVKESAQESTAAVKEETRSSSSDVKESAKESVKD